MFLLLLLFVVTYNYFAARALRRARPAWQTFWVVLSVVVDLGILAYFKYAYFLADFLNDLFGLSIQVHDVLGELMNGITGTTAFRVDAIILPVGISFFTFQAVSYIVDVKRGKIEPLRKFLDFGFFLTFFPQLVAGPIVRAPEFFPQLYKPYNLRMFPALTNTPMASISRSSSGGFSFFTMIVDSTTRRAGHNRYGPLSQVTSFTGNGTVSLRAQKLKSTQEHVRSFQSVSLLYGRASDDFTAAVQSDTLKPAPAKRTKGGVTWVTWTFSRPVEKATVKLAGSAEIYGVATDGTAGVTVDNIPMRGSTGHILTRGTGRRHREQGGIDLQHPGRG